MKAKATSQRAAIGTKLMQNTQLLLPPANEVCEGYIFTRVCHSVHGGVSVSVHAGIPPPPEQIPQEQTRHPPPKSNSPDAVHAGRYGQQADGMHPTGMQFLLMRIFV